MISENRSGFVRGRLITENILLTQGIRKHNQRGNVVIKLDMSKAYDRLSWKFLTKCLRNMGFSEGIIEMVYKLISNNWYSIIVNGTRKGFFNSTSGLKQGDPLSPALFIIAAEVLSRALNSLNQKEKFKGFHMRKQGTQINHLCYADDLVIFTSGDRRSIKMIIDQLSKYQLASG